MANFLIGTELRAYVDKLKGDDFEMNIPFMYMDSTGNVTVGVGHNITSHQDITLLTFTVKRLTRKAVKGGDVGLPIMVPKTLNRPATLVEKKNDYDFLKKHSGLGKFKPKGLAAYTTLEMSSMNINKLFDKDLQDAISISQNTFSGFASFPVPCQAALIDIAFNCGTFSTFHTIRAALGGTGEYAKKSWSDRWKAASQNCERGAVGDSRNREVASWFLKGVSLASKQQL